MTRRKPLSLPRTARSLAAALLGFAASVAPAWGQALNPSWDGPWIVVEASQGAPGERLRIQRDGSGTLLLRESSTCRLAYDGTVTPPAIAQRIEALRAWQLDPAHWPEGTDTAQLVGLRQEFDRARALVDALGGDSYRRVRLAGDGCASADDRFMLLHRGQELVLVVFPEASLGVRVSSLRRER